MSVGQTSRHTRGSHQCRLNWNAKHQDIRSLFHQALTLLVKSDLARYHCQSHAHSLFILLIFLLLLLLLLLVLPPSYCFLGYQANPHSKCNTNQTANYSDFLTMTTASLGQCPKPKCLASGSTLHAAPPVSCWAVHSIIRIHLLSIPCCKHGLDRW